MASHATLKSRRNRPYSWHSPSSAESHRHLAASLHHTMHAIHLTGSSAYASNSVAPTMAPFGTAHATCSSPPFRQNEPHCLHPASCIRLAGGKLHILPIAILIRILQLPRLDHRHTATVSPEEQLRLLQRTVPSQQAAATARYRYCHPNYSRSHSEYWYTTPDRR